MQFEILKDPPTREEIDAARGAISVKKEVRSRLSRSINLPILLCGIGFFVLFWVLEGSGGWVYVGAPFALMATVFVFSDTSAAIAIARQKHTPFAFLADHGPAKTRKLGGAINSNDPSGIYLAKVAVQGRPLCLGEYEMIEDWLNGSDLRAALAERGPLVEQKSRDKKDEPPDDEWFIAATRKAQC